MKLINYKLLACLLFLTSCKEEEPTSSSIKMVKGYYEGSIPLSEAVQMGDGQYVHKANESKYYNTVLKKKVAEKLLNSQK